MRPYFTTIFLNQERKVKIFFEKGFPLGIIKLLNSWIINEYADHISIQHYIKLKELYTYISFHIDSKFLAKNHNIVEMDKVNKFLKDKILFSPGDANKLNKASSLYKHKRQFVVTFKEKHEPILPKRHTFYFDILEWSEIEIARQLSLISHYLFSKIRISELFFSRFTKGDKFTNSPHIMKCIDRFNKLSLWIIEEVISYDRSSIRAKALEKFILVANECLNMNNFEDCFNIVSTLNSFLIKRLNKSWKKIKEFEVMNIFFKLNNLCSVGNNFSLFRSEIQKVVNKPCIPYLGMYLKYLSFLEEGPKYFKDNLVNVSKIKKFGIIYNEFSRNNKYIYDFKPVFMLSFLAETHPETEDNLFELSNKVEPKFKLSHTKFNKKRITSTDKKSLEMTKTFHKIVIESKNQNNTLFDTMTNKTNLKDTIKNYIGKK